MRKLITLAALLALVLPAAALADNGKSHNSENPPAAESQQPTASQTCKQQRVAIGMANFKLLYGTNAKRTNALGKCVAKLATAKRVAVSNAAKTCKAERALSDEEFKAAHENKTFAQYYGTGKNGKNAYGKCVSSHAKENADESVEAVTNAAKICKAEEKLPVADFQAAHGGKTFAEHYGTKKRKTNAFGKCVAAAVKQANTQTT